MAADADVKEHSEAGERRKRWRCFFLALAVAGTALFLTFLSDIILSIEFGYSKVPVTISCNFSEVDDIYLMEKIASYSEGLDYIDSLADDLSSKVMCSKSILGIFPIRECDGGCSYVIIPYLLNKIHHLYMCLNREGWNGCSYINRLENISNDKIEKYKKSLKKYDDNSRYVKYYNSGKIIYSMHNFIIKLIRDSDAENRNVETVLSKIDDKIYELAKDYTSKWHNTIISYFIYRFASFVVMVFILYLWICRSKYAIPHNNCDIT